MLILVLCAPARAESPADRYNRANQDYRDGNYNQAREAYQQLLDSGLKNPDLYYNLAVTDLKLARTGWALLNFTRAEKLAPRDPAIQERLNSVRREVKSPHMEDESAVSRAFSALSDSMSANEWTKILIGGYWLAALFIAASLLSRRPAVRTANRTMVFILIAVFILSLPFAGVRIHRDLFTPRAIVVEPNPPARGPDLAEEKDCGLHEGMELKIGRCREGWCQVRTSQGVSCWVPGPAFERI